MKFFVSFESVDQQIIVSRGWAVSVVFELRVIFDEFVLLVASTDQVEGVGSEDAVEFGVQHWKDLLVEGLLKHLADEVDHCLEEILVFEDEFCLAVAQ